MFTENNIQTFSARFLKGLRARSRRVSNAKSTNIGHSSTLFDGSAIRVPKNTSCCAPRPVLHETQHPIHGYIHILSVQSPPTSPHLGNRPPQVQPTVPSKIAEQELPPSKKSQSSIGGLCLQDLDLPEADAVPHLSLVVRAIGEGRVR